VFNSSVDDERATLTDESKLEEENDGVQHAGDQHSQLTVDGPSKDTAGPLEKSIESGIG
jgi:hypothetical protein